MGLDDIVNGAVDAVAGVGGAGKRTVGGDGNDRIEGSESSDEIFADPVPADDQGGNDEVWGRSGDDLIRAFGGNNLVYGGPGDDELITADGTDHVEGGPGDDEIQGGRGTDLLIGGPGDDEVRGGEDDDLLYGGPGADRVIGSSGDDVVYGGAGVDRLEGREGRDRFAWSSSDEGIDTVQGFEPGLDSLAVAGILAGQIRDEGDLEQYLTLTPEGDGTGSRLRVDREGDGPAPWRDLAIIQGHPGLSATALYLTGDLVLEGQPAAPPFPALAYIASHDDLIAAFGADAAAGKRHYLLNGHAEGRTVTFDGLQYVATHEDLIGALGADEDAAASHYIMQGQREGRSRDGFDEVQYVANYPDLQAAFGDDRDAATRQFITNGYAEGRNDEPPTSADFLV
jgi:hypothetical protein